MIYLLHLEPGLKRPNGSIVNHYLGWCQEHGLLARLKLHQKGKSGSKLVEAAVRAGSTVTLVKTWPQGGPALEQYLKRNGHLKEQCPKCEEKAHWARARSQAQRRAKRSVQQLELSLASGAPSGTGSPAPSTGPATTGNGTSPRAPRRAPTTSSGATPSAPAPGGNFSTATVRRSRAAGTVSAGTRLPST